MTTPRRHPLSRRQLARMTGWLALLGLSYLALFNLSIRALAKVSTDPTAWAAALTVTALLTWRVWHVRRELLDEQRAGEQDR